MKARIADLMARQPGSLKLALAALAGVGLAWQIVALSLADQHAQELGDPVAALTWDAGHPGANLAVGQRLLASDPDAALAHLKAAIAANPADGRAYAALGRLLESRGEATRARLAMETASRVSPQRSDVQLEVAAYWMRQDDLPRALRHWNTVLARQGSLRDRVFPDLLKLAADPARQPAFASMLKEPVPWWPAFFTHAARTAADADTVRALYRLPQGGPNAATPEMLRAFLARLQKEGAWFESWVVWLDSLSPAEVKRVGYLYNGSFEAPLTDLGFDWIHQPHPAVLLDTAGTYDTVGDRALRVSFRGLRVQFQHLHQYLMLPPGEFRLQGRVRADNLQAPQGMQWALYCVGAKAPFAASDRFRGSTPWTRFRTQFAIPADGCPVQMLRLELAGSVRLDFDASGTIWFDDLAVEKLQSPPTTASVAPNQHGT